jgi:hypothetical protein
MVIEHGYLVERYLPDATIEQVADATGRARELAREAGSVTSGRRSCPRRAAASACSRRPRPRKCVSSTSKPGSPSPTSSRRSYPAEVREAEGTL